MPPMFSCLQSVGFIKQHPISSMRHTWAQFLSWQYADDITNPDITPCSFLEWQISKHWTSARCIHREKNLLKKTNVAEMLRSCFWTDLERILTWGFDWLLKTRQTNGSPSLVRQFCLSITGSCQVCYEWNTPVSGVVFGHISTFPQTADCVTCHPDHYPFLIFSC